MDELLPLLNDDERQRILVSFNDTAHPFPHDALIHQLFEQQARQQPDAIAVVYETQRISYRELNERANQIAHSLIGLGLRPDDRVAVCLERSLEMVIALLGILKAGACYVPLDPAYPAERLAHMLRDSAPVALLTQRPLLDALPAHDAHLLLLDEPDTAARLGHGPTHDPDPAALGLCSRHLAYVIYTSGSTGTPKGVMIEHRSVINLWQGLEKTVFGKARDVVRVGQNAALSFDASVQALMQLLSGRTLVLIPQAIRTDSGAFLDYLVKHDVDAFDCTPSQLAFLIDDGVLHHNALNLKVVLVGGEAIGGELWQRLASLAGTQVYNLYGPTECTVDATLGLVSELGERPSIGRPIANTQIYILDTHRQPVPVGVAGEIHIGGVGLARGYLGQPDLTAQRFVANPFDSTAQSRLYKSGDLARWLPDGTIEYLGRNDFQVKLRGFRIELGEIESQLRACPGVRGAVVIAREDSPGDKRLVAYLLATPDAQEAPDAPDAPDAPTALAAATLRDRLASRLPDYMVPSAFVTLDAWPLTPNGKLDRRALPAPDAGAVATREYAAPQGQIETAIAQIWQSLLGIERIGRHDDFFELGGHSLLAVQMVSRVRQTLGVEIALRELFAHPTLVQLASIVKHRDASSGARSSLVAIRSHGKQPPIFFVHPIEGEVGYARALAAALDPDRPVYALAAAGLLQGEIPLTSIAAMATRYLNAIRDVQPQGPYCLAGWSAGGTIAYEMAYQLIGRDERVEFLGLIDTRADYRNSDAGGTLPASASRVTEADLLIDLACSARMSAEAIDELRRLADANALDAMLARCKAAGAIAPDIDIDLLRRHLRLRHATKQALLTYMPPPLSVCVNLFTADERGRSVPALGWASLPGIRLQQVTIGGTHQSIVEHPHAERLAVEIDQALARSRAAAQDAPELQYCPRVTLQTGPRDAPPLFVVPGAGACVTAFFELAQTLDLDVPIHGLQPRGLDGTLVPHIDVQCAANAYLKAVKDVAPDGRFSLLGHSYGGWIALEMATRLKEAGAAIGALVLLDSDVPGKPLGHEDGNTALDTLLSLIRHFELSAQRSLNLGRQELEELSDDARVQRLLTRLIDAQILPRQTRLESVAGIVRVFRANLNAPYVPRQPYTDTVHLVLADYGEQNSEQPGEESARIAQWQQYAPKLQIWRSSGNHMTLLHKPHVTSLAARLRQLLREGTSHAPRSTGISTNSSARTSDVKQGTAMVATVIGDEQGIRH
jgi:amino acid adenylation domain-containing protein